MIYRVVAKSTLNLRPSDTYWNKSVLYCGTDLEAARVAYLKHRPSDGFHGYGNRATETTIEQFESAPEDIDSEDGADVIVEADNG